MSIIVNNMYTKRLEASVTHSILTQRQVYLALDFTIAAHRLVVIYPFSSSAYPSMVIYISGKAELWIAEVSTCVRI